MRKIDMIGHRYGRLVVIEEASPLDYKGIALRQFTVRCDCGAVKIVRGYYLRHGMSHSCGCLRRDLVTQKNTTHGEAKRGPKTPEYSAWSDMIKRCEDPNFKQYADWGGRGISICLRWRRGEDGKTGFQCFLADMGRKPSPSLTLDRYPDNDGNYEPTNCRWATRKEQANNQRPRRRR